MSVYHKIYLYWQEIIMSLEKWPAVVKDVVSNCSLNNESRNVEADCEIKYGRPLLF